QGTASLQALVPCVSSGRGRLRLRLALLEHGHDLGPVKPLEDERARGDPSVAQPEILDAEHRSDWCVGDEVVDHACLITVDEEVTDVVSLDDREQPPERADERVPAAGG